MDTPKVGPLTPIGSLLKSVSRVLLDPNGQSVDPTKPGGAKEVDSVKRPVAQAPIQEVDRKDDKFPSLESMLPIKILANPLLKGSEWAWKRLITSLLENGNIASNEQSHQKEILKPEANSGFFLDATEGTFPAVGNELQPSASSTVQEAISIIQDFNAVQTPKSTVTEEGQPQPANSNPVNPNPANANQNTTVQENLGPTIVAGKTESNQVSIVPAGSQSLQSQMPPVSLDNGTGTIHSVSNGFDKSLQGDVVSEVQTEPTMVNSPQAGLSPHTVPNASSAGNQYEAAIKVLWSMLTVATTQSNKDMSKAQVQGLQHKGPIVEFAGLSHSEFKGELPQTVQQWVLEDRLTASVQFDAYERVGQGIFFPPGQTTDKTRQAVRWHAKKQTKITGQGKLIHRIQFDLMVNYQPVKCTLISAKPSVIVHFDTNDTHLQQHLRLGQSVIEQTLRIAGWRLEKWSVSPYDNEAEME